MEHESGTLRTAAAIVWRRQRILWWLFVLDLGIMVVGARPVSRALVPLDFSLISDRLVHGMDLGVLVGVLLKPELSGATVGAGAVLPQILYFMLVLFFTGGILTIYAADRRHSTGEFFQACGVHFWRLVRLFVCFAITMIPVVIIPSFWSAISSKLAENASEKASFWLSMSNIAVLLVLFLIVRLWFDMAQVRAVIEDQRAVRRTLIPSLKQTFGSFGRLFPLFVLPALLGAIAFFVAGWVWTKVPGHRYGVSFAVWQLLVLFWIGMRLWQRATETVWYQRHRVIEPAPIVISEPVAPAPTETPAPAAETPMT